MENTSKITLELEVHAQRIISQYMLHNESIEADIKIAVENAFNKFNFQKAIEDRITFQLEQAVSRSTSWDKIHTLTQTRVNEIVDKFVDTQLNNVRQSLNIQDDTK